METAQTLAQTINAAVEKWLELSGEKPPETRELFAREKVTFSRTAEQKQAAEYLQQVLPGRERSIASRAERLCGDWLRQTLISDDSAVVLSADILKASEEQDVDLTPQTLSGWLFSQGFEQVMVGPAGANRFKNPGRRLTAWKGLKLPGTPGTLGEEYQISEFSRGDEWLNTTLGNVVIRDSQESASFPFVLASMRKFAPWLQSETAQAFLQSRGFWMHGRGAPIAKKVVLGMKLRIS